MLFNIEAKGNSREALNSNRANCLSGKHDKEVNLSEKNPLGSMGSYYSEWPSSC